MARKEKSNNIVTKSIDSNGTICSIDKIRPLIEINLNQECKHPTNKTCMWNSE